MVFIRNLFSRKLRPGDMVHVRPFDEIKSTLDENGQLDNMPFMPEMIQYCGKQFQISKRVNYVCVDGDGMRGLDNTVILKDIWCDGSAHYGCQKLCTIFWKEAWLVKTLHNFESEDSELEKKSGVNFLKLRDENSNVYICQSTRLAASTRLLKSFSKIQFLFKELFSGNRGINKFIVNFCYFIHYKLSKNSSNSVCQILRGKVKQAPRVSLNLKAGDWIEIKSLEEIVETLDMSGKNHGLVFTAEMHHFCGKRYKVKQRLDKMVSETSGKMVKLRDTVLLENVQCYGICKFGCARHLYHYWREIWLNKI